MDGLNICDYLYLTRNDWKFRCWRVAFVSNFLDMTEVAVVALEVVATTTVAVAVESDQPKAENPRKGTTLAVATSFETEQIERFR